MSHDANDESESSMSSLSSAASSCNTHLSLSYHLTFNDFSCVTLAWSMARHCHLRQQP
jgi:hypothetical protein